MRAELASGDVGYKVNPKGVVVSASVSSLRNGYDSWGNEPGRHQDSWSCEDDNSLSRRSQCLCHDHRGPNNEDAETLHTALHTVAACAKTSVWGRR